jgi:hypothetical protein
MDANYFITLSTIAVLFILHEVYQMRREAKDLLTEIRDARRDTAMTEQLEIRILLNDLTNNGWNVRAVRRLRRITPLLRQKEKSP